MIFVNFPSDDLARSRTFYEALGCEINPMFTDGNVLEFFYMDPEAAAQDPDNYLAEHVAAEVLEPI